MNKLTQPGKKLANSQLVIALVSTLVVTIITYFGWGLSFAVSALCGGSIAVIPNFMFAQKAFKYAGARAAKKVVDAFYSGVKLKMFVTALLFALSFKFLELQLLPFFLTYCLALLSPFIQALMYKFTFNQL